jgi:hypothetical protein
VAERNFKIELRDRENGTARGGCRDNLLGAGEGEAEAEGVRLGNGEEGMREHPPPRHDALVCLQLA